MSNEPTATNHDLRRLAALLAVPLAIALVGCHAKPDRVQTFRSETSPVYYTIETFHGSGAISTDYTRIFAHYDQGKKSATQLALSGPYLEATKLRWNSPADVDFCVQNDRIVESNGTAQLSAGGKTIQIQQHVNKLCDR